MTLCIIAVWLTAICTIILSILNNYNLHTIIMKERSCLVTSINDKSLSIIVAKK